MHFSRNYQLKKSWRVGQDSDLYSCKLHFYKWMRNVSKCLEPQSNNLKEEKSRKQYKFSFDFTRSTMNFTLPCYKLHKLSYKKLASEEIQASLIEDSSKYDEGHIKHGLHIPGVRIFTWNIEWWRPSYGLGVHDRAHAKLLEFWWCLVGLDRIPRPKHQLFQPCRRQKSKRWVEA